MICLFLRAIYLYTFVFDSSFVVPATIRVRVEEWIFWDPEFIRIGFSFLVFSLFVHQQTGLVIVKWKRFENVSAEK